MSLKTLFAMQLTLVAVGCGGGTVDVTATRGAGSFHFSGGDCDVNFSGFDIAGDATAVDLVCPKNRLPPREGGSLHISVLLNTPANKDVPLRDNMFGDAGYNPGQLVVVRYRDGAATITCNPRQAVGALTYYEIPKFRSGGRLVGAFSADAALSTCTVEGGSDPGGGALKLSGRFDMVASGK